MKFLLLFLLLFSASHADRIKTKTLACPSIDKLQKAPVADESEGLDLEMYVIANGCAILSPENRVEALGYDPRNSKEIYIKVVDKNDGNTYYMLRSQIYVEQGGKKAFIRF